MQDRPYPEVPPDFGHWLAGFIDGEGTFIIDSRRNPPPPAGEQRYCCRLSLVLRDDDRAILEEICRITGIGHVVAKAPQVRAGVLCRAQAGWHVRAKGQCLALIALLDRYPLRAKKARDYAIWREAVLEWSDHERHGRTRGDWKRLGQLKDELAGARAYGA